MTAEQETPALPIPGLRPVKTSYCGSCGKPLCSQRIGRPKKYCGSTCKQRAYEDRKTAEAGGVPEGATVLTAEQVQAFGDALFALQCGVEDVVSAAEDGQSTMAEVAHLAHQALSHARGMELK